MSSVALPLAVLTPDPTQPRKSVSDDKVDDLAKSILARGQLQPLRVKPADADGKHVIISGHRRFNALHAIGATTAECIVVDDPHDAAAILAAQMTENLHRENLSPIEEAEGYFRYLDVRQITAARAAEELQVFPARISRALALLALPEELRTAVHTGHVPKETAYHLSRLPEGSERDRLITEALAGSLRRDTAVRAAKVTKGSTTAVSVRRVVCRLPGNRSLTLVGPAIHLDTMIEALESTLKEARKARTQGWDVSTLAKVFKDRAAHEGTQSSDRPAT
ncbi:chromosome partitioning protein : ParB-like partition protein OS=Singulisphaera acidiphila (strain ATCC BAA-1392 / DSM 18658 / VKM B-2454 / MOB10) GN=Sinac_7661 PE=4 SV=1: ParBc [Gemmata massiliana]|uniref:ParB-like N-terminal domain-containing protein n=1 Tax=Gemmata massiliana TaxID=1210884 RepID=A0A6P2DF93_9BACT|nr:ParB/RepB/Spo0J family partition protein [Gemmata massiliana]VTS00405.1 chromosome partitioning protein : ParB-like partition protein OS=Singulisphaera acidiphila (strain ATCC BAA-1392 / DSM 18658 / VKM B-2454 / MOB10) GN=Sinac_7661 PE=4 SV=1: ParBc [Gemmata massiliana]